MISVMVHDVSKILLTPKHHIGDGNYYRDLHVEFDSNGEKEEVVLTLFASEPEALAVKETEDE